MASIREIRPGSWRVEWREGGRGSKKHYRFFKTEEEARAFVADPTGMGIGAVGTRIGLPSFIAELSRGKPTPKFSDYARELIASADLRPNSRKMYMTALRRVEREAIAEKPSLASPE